MGYPNIYLDVEEKNPKAIGLYEKTGFEITAIHDFYRRKVIESEDEVEGSDDIDQSQSKAEEQG